jgi:hypothetical protein
MNPIKFWLIIKDDSKRTFEVWGQASSENAFTNKVYAMQKAGMNVSAVTPPVTNKTQSKQAVKFTGYKQEDGLYERLHSEYQKKTMGSIDWESLTEE